MCTMACPEAHQLGAAPCHLPTGQWSTGRALLLPLKLLGSSLSLGYCSLAWHAPATNLSLARQLKEQVGQKVEASDPGFLGGECS